MLKVRNPPFVIPIVDWNQFAVCRVLQRQVSRVKRSSFFFLSPVSIISYTLYINNTVNKQSICQKEGALGRITDRLHLGFKDRL